MGQRGGIGTSGGKLARFIGERGSGGSVGRGKNRSWVHFSRAGISLYRRFLLAIIFSTSFTDLNMRGMLTAAACVVFLTLNLVLKPLENRLSNSFETFALLVLSMISVLSLPELSFRQFGSLEPVVRANILEWVVFLLSLLPGASFPVIFALVKWRQRQATRGQRSESGSALVVAGGSLLEEGAEDEYESVAVGEENKLSEMSEEVQSSSATGEGGPVGEAAEDGDGFLVDMAGRWAWA